MQKLHQKGVLVSDGAWGTFLQKKGLSQSEAPESWNVTHRNEVLEIAKSYIEAGADIIETNSFGGSKIKLDHFGLADDAFNLNKAAAEISRQAAEDDVVVMGSIGPTGKFIMMGDVSEDDLYSVFKEQAVALEDGGADAVIIETFYDLMEAEAAFKAVKENTKLDIVCSFTFDKKGEGEYRTMMGHTVEECLNFCIEKKVDVIGTNCGNGFEAMIDIVREIRNFNSQIPILVQANAGLPILENGKLLYPETPELVGRLVPNLISAGATIIGGCCGTTPEHIAAIKSEVVKFLNN